MKTKLISILGALFLVLLFAVGCDGEGVMGTSADEGFYSGDIYNLKRNFFRSRTACRDPEFF